MRRILILLVGLVSAFMVKGQDFDIGGNVSLNTSWILNQNAYEVLQKVCPEDPLIIDSEPGYALTMGYSLGAVGSYTSDRFWGVSAELNYTKRGQNYKDSWTGNGCARGDINNFKRKFSLHYLELPLLVKFKPQSRKKITGYGELGLQFGVLLAAKERISIDGESTGEFFGSANDKVKRLDFGFVFGGGIDVNLSRNLYLNAGLRGYFGFLDLNKGDAAVFISDNDNTYQSSRNFSLGANVSIHYVFDWVGGMYR
ncbi:MAG: porin family protein [Chitinophagales bacterium]